jgi:hypothetical protein
MAPSDYLYLIFSLSDTTCGAPTFFCRRLVSESFLLS